MKFDIITIFPQQIVDFTKYGVLRIAQEVGNVEIDVHDLRDWATDKHKSIDDRPFGGGPGMVIKVEPIDNALQQLRTAKSVVILPSPRGKRLDQQIVRSLAADPEAHYIIIAGHYEALDERIHQYLVDHEISMGDYILSGGELPALVLMDTISRLQPGVLGNDSSPDEESFENGLIEFPQYTRPEKYKDWSVPEILLTGDHGKIKEWRRSSSIRLTEEVRPDLLRKAV